MLFKGEKSMPDTEGPEKRNPGNREFMREKIVKQPLSKRQIAKRVLILMCLAVLFGVISAVSFVLAKPLADRYLGREETEESTSIVFAKDDPETAAVGPTQEETLPIHVEEEELQKAIEDALTRYSFTPDNLNSFYSSLRDVAVQADKGIVKISSGKQQTDLFGNPVESTGDYAGAVIAKTPGEYLIFTCADAVRQADSISVTFSDGTKVTGQTKQIDEVLNMAVISVKCQELGEELRKDTHSRQLLFREDGRYRYRSRRSVGTGTLHDIRNGLLHCKERSDDGRHHKDYICRYMQQLHYGYVSFKYGRRDYRMDL